MGNTEAPFAPALMAATDFTRQEITAGLRAHEDLIFQFASAWYRNAYTFRSTRVFGYAACKIPMDLWVMHDLFCQYKFQTVVETGTAGGGATLWYAILMDILGIDGGQVFSIDVDGVEVHGPRPLHQRIRYVHGNSTDPAIVDEIAAQIAGPTLINLDSDHHAPHVLQELALWAPLVPIGGWLVVEDTNGAPVEVDRTTGHQVMVEGSFAAVMEYLAQHPGEFLRDVVCERFWLTMNPYGWLQRVGAHV